jgi:glycosyltransferase AglD
VTQGFAGLPPFSALVPVYNEAPLLANSLTRMAAALRTFGVPFEILVCENGSTDGSLAIAQGLRTDYPEIRVEHLPDPDYGLALKHGVTMCRHDCIVVFNLDFWSDTFARDALQWLGTCDVVVGSKTLEGSSDRRPPFRRWITRSFNGFLRYTFGFRGTDTHGMKAVRRTPVLPILAECVTGGWILDTELVLRVERRGLRIVEIPVEIREIRPPSYGSILRRTPRVLRALLTLWRALRHLPQTEVKPVRSLYSERPLDRVE